MATQRVYGPKKQRLIVVTNRLPVSVLKSEKKDRKTKPKLKISDGGLVSALKNLSGLYQMEWIGWVGNTVDDEAERVWIKNELARQNCHPVFLPFEIAEGYYNGFCNNVLWPLFHYIPVPIEGIRLASKQWGAYCEANALFGKTVLDVWREGDLVWIHDYHLMLLPSILRVAHPSMHIGFFSHVPFPSSEIYRILPVRKEILEGVLCSNLIGFHTHDYARHFVSTCVRALGTAAVEKGVRHRGKTSQVAAFPIGITPSKFINCLKTQAVETRLQDLKFVYKGQKMILGVDRLDYIKGLPLKLKAMERFFTDNPQWIGKVVLLQIAVPSRGAIDEYKKLKRQTHELVGRINGRFGSFESGIPIHYLDKAVPFDQLCALYRFADVMLVTSVRDGMNLVAYEYIVCQEDKHGVLILSEFAGAAQSLGAGCVQVNPWNTTETSRAIKYALEMSEEEKKRFHTYAYKHVTTHDTKAWAKEFLTTLGDTFESKAKKRGSGNSQLSMHLSIPVRLSMQQVTKDYRRATNRLVIYGIHGTLSHTTRQEGLSTGGFGYLQVAEKVRKDVAKLAAEPNTTLVLISSSSRRMMSKCFGDTQAWLGAENGFFLSKPPNKMAGSDTPAGTPREIKSIASKEEENVRVWEVTQENVDLSWKRKVTEVFEYFRERTPSSFIRNHETSIEWHYHDVPDKVFAKMQANELVGHLRSGTLLNTNTEIVDTDSIVRIRHLGVSKGAGAIRIIEEVQNEKELEDETDGIDYILCVGNLTLEDEDLFIIINSLRFTDQEMHPLGSIWQSKQEQDIDRSLMSRSASCPSLSALLTESESQSHTAMIHSSSQQLRNSDAQGANFISTPNTKDGTLDITMKLRTPKTKPDHPRSTLSLSPLRNRPTGIIQTAVSLTGSPKPTLSHAYSSPSQLKTTLKKTSPFSTPTRKPSHLSPRGSTPRRLGFPKLRSSSIFSPANSPTKAPSWGDHVSSYARKSGETAKNFALSLPPPRLGGVNSAPEISGRIEETGRISRTNSMGSNVSQIPEDDEMNEQVDGKLAESVDSIRPRMKLDKKHRIRANSTDGSIFRRMSDTSSIGVSSLTGIGPTSPKNKMMRRKSEFLGNRREAKGDLGGDILEVDEKVKVIEDKTGKSSERVPPLKLQGETQAVRTWSSRTDADASLMAQVSIYTCTVGRRESHARFYLSNIKEPAELLSKLAKATNQQSQSSSDSTPPPPPQTKSSTKDEKKNVNVADIHVLDEKLHQDRQTDLKTMTPLSAKDTILEQDDNVRNNGNVEKKDTDR